MLGLSYTSPKFPYWIWWKSLLNSWFEEIKNLCKLFASLITIIVSQKTEEVNSFFDKIDLNSIFVKSKESIYDQKLLGKWWKWSLEKEERDNLHVTYPHFEILNISFQDTKWWFKRGKFGCWNSKWNFNDENKELWQLLLGKTCDAWAEHECIPRDLENNSCLKVLRKPVLI